ncbi:transposable element tc1 transposase [Anaeramoeba flamelloides]|uniref:Transposable element tc1 transposase n=1 Tax=Anaeramoeba flamelloides TaxID=1746091 RepID=A0AAV7YEY8_9EUKA|nr:transposable element tc1 transposase [Anaeramoeba flamelloides]
MEERMKKLDQERDEMINVRKHMEEERKQMEARRTKLEKQLDEMQEEQTEMKDKRNVMENELKQLKFEKLIFEEDFETYKALKKKDLQIEKQNEQIDKQNKQIKEQNKQIKEQNNRIDKQDEKVNLQALTNKTKGLSIGKLPQKQNPQQEHKTQGKLQKRLEIGLSKVRYCIKIWKEEHRISKKKRGVKKREFENDLKNFVLEETVENRTMSCQILSNKCKTKFPNSKCSPTTIYRIRKSLNFDYKPPRIRQSLNEIQIAKRLLFALDHKSNKTDWARVLFTDESWVIKKANREYGCLNWIFQQDGARPHTSRKTMDFLNRGCQVMNPWPPNIPDLNPIENLWSIMDRRLKHVNPKNKEEFIDQLINVWESIKWETLENLTLSMDNRINLVIERDGQSINGFF